jgi:hypothetical protein
VQFSAVVSAYKTSACQQAESFFPVCLAHHHKRARTAHAAFGVYAVFPQDPDASSTSMTSMPEMLAGTGSFAGIAFPLPPGFGPAAFCVRRDFRQARLFGRFDTASASFFHPPGQLRRIYDRV